MSSAAGEDSSSSRKGKEREEDGAGESYREEGVAVMEGEVDLGDLYGAAAGWVEARTSCPHLGTMPPAGAAELARVPPPDSPCSSDLSVWCFGCDSYLDVQAILELRPVYEIAHLLKFGDRPPFRSLEVLDLSTGNRPRSFKAN
ncbi:histone deacetylase 6 [Panicum miliaceum]|uniref:Histone deacetylase 6 n=1 Tax=Panicum miliaceum TaxID=4540 RepID=A0A3L6R5T4_PANMI|nr:histone deacetylase 6 [Panicum miliaceum]